MLPIPFCLPCVCALVRVVRARPSSLLGVLMVAVTVHTQLFYIVCAPTSNLRSLHTVAPAFSFAAEEVSTTSMDAAATDAAEARATGGHMPAHHRGSGGAAEDQPAADEAAVLASAATLDGQADVEGSQESEQQQPLLDPNNLSLLVQLHNRWAGHQLRHHIANAAQGLGTSISTARSLVSPFHPFGEQYYISEAGVVPVADLPADMPLSEASLAFSAANPGLINFHRLVSRQQGCRALPGGTAGPLQGSCLLEPLNILFTAFSDILFTCLGGQSQCLCTASKWHRTALYHADQAPPPPPTTHTRTRVLTRTRTRAHAH